MFAKTRAIAERIQMKNRRFTATERIIGMGIIGTSRRVDYVARNSAPWMGGYSMKKRK
jgi:hypothetical protein